MRLRQRRRPSRRAGTRRDATPTGDGTDAQPVRRRRLAGRQQVDFAISVTAADMAQATAFLDALRAGPRLLSSITATATQTGEGSVDVQVSALTYVDAEG